MTPEGAIETLSSGETVTILAFICVVLAVFLGGAVVFLMKQLLGSFAARIADKDAAISAVNAAGEAIELVNQERESLRKQQQELLLKFGGSK